MDTRAHKYRQIAVEGLSMVEVRRPILRDTVEGRAEDAWWWRCVRIDGKQATEDQILGLDVDHANAIATEVMRPRPTTPGSAVSGG